MAVSAGCASAASFFASGSAFFACLVSRSCFADLPRARAAHIEREVADQTFGRVQIDGIVKRPAMPGDADEASGCQVCQMMRQGVLLQAKRLGDLGWAHALRGEAHQEAKNCKSTRMAERGEGMSGAILFHISRL